MKKVLSLVLVVVLMLSMATVAFADNTTTLTTTVPGATYTLNIPADQEIEFGATSTAIEALTITDATGFAVGKNLKVNIAYDSFKSETTSTVIPFLVNVREDGSSNSYRIWNSGESLICYGKENGTVDSWVQYHVSSSAARYEASLYFIKIDSEDWGKALAGDYSATITFTAEVVVEE